MKTLVRHAAASLLSRILLVEGATILAACVLMPLTARAVLDNSVHAIEDGMLRQQADLVAGYVFRTADGGWRVALPPPQLAIYVTRYDGRAYALLDGQGHVLAASPFAVAAAWPTPFIEGRTASFASGDMVGLSRPLPAPHDTIRVVVTQDQARPGAVVDDVVRSFLQRYFIWLLAILLLMPLANIAMLWPLLRRLRRTASDAARLTPQRPDVRLDPTGLPAETLTLVSAINNLLGRVEAALQLQQEFAGNVAHELRTPLATLRIEVSKLTDGAARATLTTQIERIAHVLAQLRDLASLENTAVALTTLDLSDLTVTLAAELTPAVLAGGRSIAVTGAEQPILVRGNRGLLVMALRNLIENANIHTPHGTAIEILLDPAGRISVADNGPGIAEDDSTRLTRRFWRADHRRSDGAGLGLSIVQHIATVHGGQLVIATPPQGGTCFTLVLCPAGKT